MKIAYLVNQYPKVSHSFIRREILALEEQGFEIIRIALRGWKEELPDSSDRQEQQKTQYILQNSFLKLATIGLINLARSPLKFFSAMGMAIQLSMLSNRRLPLHFISLIEACYVKDIVSKENVQHLHAHFGTNSTEIALYQKLLGGAEYSFTVHGPEEFDKPEALHLKEKVHYAKFIVAISDFGKSQLYRWAEYKYWSKIHVIHCVLDSSFLAEKETPLPQAHQFLCVGRLCEQKGQMLLIEACKLFKEQGGDFTLTLAGDGEFRERIEQEIKDCQLETEVTITGWVSTEKVIELINNHRYFILPSFAEGLPVVIMEAMALKRPVITTCIAGIPELVINDHTGFLITAGDADRVARKMADVCKLDDNKINRITANGRKAVMEQHHIDIETHKLGQLFRGEML